MNQERTSRGCLWKKKPKLSQPDITSPMALFLMTQKRPQVHERYDC
jgi:hypothetical protein